MVRGPAGVTRRQFVKTVGVVGGIGMAGCIQEVNVDNPGNGGNGVSGEVIVKGSSTVFPISDRMAEDFMAEHPTVNVTVDSTGSGGGFENWFCPGDADINGASRPITEAEIEQCSGNSVEPVEFRIAGDALTVVVNNEATWVDCMTFDELSQIWREGGAQRWSDVRDDWPDREFRLFGPAETSGTYDWFNQNVIGEDIRHTAEHNPSEEDETIVQGIRDNVGGMGYLGYAYYAANQDQVKAVEIKGEDGDGCTQPSLSNAKDGSYPLARPLFVYAAESSLRRPAVYEFMRFYLRRAETDVIEDVGYVPSSESQRDENLETLDEVSGR